MAYVSVLSGKIVSGINVVVCTVPTTKNVFQRFIFDCPWRFLVVLDNRTTTITSPAYEALVRPHLENACTLWDPHTQVNVRRLDSVQRRAARYVCNHWHSTSSVSTMLHELSWESLARRRERARLYMINKVVHGLVDIPWLQNKVQ